MKINHAQSVEKISSSTLKMRASLISSCFYLEEHVTMIFALIVDSCWNKSASLCFYSFITA